uniref:Putative transposable element n=1 Tax=Ixodes ricinus TaxID=34613 RepID=A0A147BJU3_IXORI
MTATGAQPLLMDVTNAVQPTLIALTLSTSVLAVPGSSTLTLPERSPSTSAATSTSPITPDLMSQLKERIQQLERQSKLLKRRNLSLTRAKENLESNLRGLFNDDQILFLSRRGKTQVKWSPQTIKDSLQIHFSCGTTGYNVLRSKQQPYPSTRTLRRRLEGIKFEPGILGEVFVLLKAKVSHLREEERKCVLMIDEMAIQDKFEYDTSTGCIRGWTTLTVPGVPKNTQRKATHALVFMLGGASSRWKQVVAYHYTGW